VVGPLFEEPGAFDRDFLARKLAGFVGAQVAFARVDLAPARGVGLA
jgi:hypothetical protein